MGAKSPEETGLSKETSVAAEIKQGKKISPKQAVVDEASSAIVTASPARRGRKAKAADLEVTALAKEAKKEHEEEENEEEKKKRLCRGRGARHPRLPRRKLPTTSRS